MTTFKVDLTGDYKTEIYGADRRLLAEGADPLSTIEIWRNGRLAMTGAVGKCALYTVRENEHGNPSLRLERYKKFVSFK